MNTLSLQLWEAFFGRKNVTQWKVSRRSDSGGKNSSAFYNFFSSLKRPIKPIRIILSQREITPFPTLNQPAFINKTFHDPSLISRNSLKETWFLLIASGQQEFSMSMFDALTKWKSKEMEEIARQTSSKISLWFNDFCRVAQEFDDFDAKLLAGANYP